MTRVLDNQRKRRRRNRPESGRTATRSFASGDAIASPGTTFDLNGPNLFGCDVVLATGSEGVIFEAGSNTGNAALVAVFDGNLIVRAGNAATPLNDATARIAYPIARLPKAQRVRLAWFFQPSASVGLIVRAWVNGSLIGDAQSVVANNAWSDDAAGGFDSVQGTFAVEPNQVSQAYTASGSAITSRLSNYDGVVVPGRF